MKEKRNFMNTPFKDLTPGAVLHFYAKALMIIFGFVIVFQLILVLYGAFWGQVQNNGPEKETSAPKSKPGANK